MGRAIPFNTGNCLSADKVNYNGDFLCSEGFSQLKTLTFFIYFFSLYNFLYANTCYPPPWINELPQDDTIYWGIGEVQIKKKVASEEEQKIAYLYAVNELSLMAGQTIYSSFINYIKETGQNHSGVVENKAVYNIKTICRNNLQGIVIKDEWTDECKKKYYVFAAINQNKANQQLREHSEKEEKLVKMIIDKGLKQLGRRINEVEKKVDNIGNQLNEIGENIKKLFQGQEHKRDSIEYFSQGEINWSKELIRVKGYGAPNMNFSPPARNLSAQEAARIEAQTKLLEMIGGFKIESKTLMKNFEIKSDEKIKNVKGIIKGAYQIGNTVYHEDGTAEVTVEVNIQNILKSNGE